MRKLFATIALALLPVGAFAADPPQRVTAPAAAFTNVPDFDAFGSVAIGYTGWEVREFLEQSLNVEARATFASTLSGAFGFQADGMFEGSYYSSDEITNNTGSLAGHVFWRDSNKGLLGVIAQGNAKSGNFTSDRQYFLGVEAQYFIGNVTLYGQVAYQSLAINVYSVNADANGFALAGQVRYFTTPNFMLALRGEYSDLSFDGVAAGMDHIAWSLGGKAEYRFAASPISVFAEADYRRGAFKVAADSLWETDKRFMIGAKWNLGSQTLFQRDRSGASLDPVRWLYPAVTP